MTHPVLRAVLLIATCFVLNPALAASDARAQYSASNASARAMAATRYSAALTEAGRSTSGSGTAAPRPAFGALLVPGGRPDEPAPPPPPPKTTFEQYTERADAGDVEAIRALASAYDVGVGNVPQDSAKSLQLWRNAADRGDLFSQAYLGGRLVFGERVTRDTAKGLQYLQAAYAKGSGDAAAYIAEAKEQGLAGPSSRTEIRALYREAAEKGSVPGAFRYANNIYNAGDAALMRTGAQWAKFAADSGAPEGWVQYGLYVEAGLGGLVRDPVAARALYAKAANTGNIWGRGQMGGAYLMGIGGPQDIPRGIALWEQVVAEGYLAPADMLGFLFRGKLSPLEGKTPLDPVKARRYSLIAAERGDAESQFLVAEDLYWGSGGPVDAVGAVRWARASAATVALAHRILGLAYDTGKGVAKDEKQAAFHFQRGAEAGDAESQWRYAWALYNADRDVLEPPLRLLKLAASQGHSGAIIDLGTAKLWGWFKQPADVPEGVRLLTDVINRQDHADAYYALGRFYAKGPVPYRNRALALDNLQKATDRGHTDSAAVMQALLAPAKP